MSDLLFVKLLVVMKLAADLTIQSKLPDSALKLSLEDNTDIAGSEVGELLVDSPSRDIVIARVESSSLDITNNSKYCQWLALIMISQRSCGPF